MQVYSSTVEEAPACAIRSEILDDPAGIGYRQIKALRARGTSASDSEREAPAVRCRAFVNGFHQVVDAGVSRHWLFASTFELLLK